RCAGASRARGRRPPEAPDRSDRRTAEARPPGEVLRVVELAFAEVLVAEIVAPHAVEDARRTRAGAVIDDPARHRDDGAERIHGVAPRLGRDRVALARIDRRPLDALAVEPLGPVAQIHLLAPPAEFALALERMRRDRVRRH